MGKIQGHTTFLSRTGEGDLSSDLRSPLIPLVSARVLVYVSFLILVSDSACAFKFEDRFMILKTVGSCSPPPSAIDSDDNVRLLCGAVKLSTEACGLQRPEFPP